MGKDVEALEMIINQLEDYDAASECLALFLSSPLLSLFSFSPLPTPLLQPPPLLPARLPACPFSLSSPSSPIPISPSLLRPFRCPCAPRRLLAVLPLPRRSTKS